VLLHRAAAGLLTAGLLLSACAPATISDSPDAAAPAVSQPVTTAGGQTAPVLAGQLTANCDPAGGSSGGPGSGLAVGATAIDFTLEDIDGAAVSLSALLAERPVVLIFGSFT
jgi:cytochrome oxidase Cu insertion factor (SCO1/SenC/PrrC family)